MSVSDHLESLEEVDRRASAFEQAWRREERPRIVDYLEGQTGEVRRSLLHELVLLDLTYRHKSSDNVALDDYVRVFPELLEDDGSIPADLVLEAEKLRAHESSGPEIQVLPGHVDHVDAANSTHFVRCPDCGERVPVPGSGGEATCGNCSHRFGVATGSEVPFPMECLPRTLGRFQLLELLGQGSFGAVYLARDESLGRMVAIKVPRSGAFAAPQDRERFLREARHAARLHHAAIVSVHEIAHAGELAFIVSDYVDGRTLAQQLVVGRVSFTEAAELIAQVAEALDHAHQNSVIHRDINPRNILIDKQGKPHVTDFGLAHGDESSVFVSVDGQILGTPAYMSPEQAEGKLSQVGPTSDVYALGVVLYELLTGEPPFRGTVTMILHQVIHEEPRSPRSLNDRVPHDLETICLKAMEKSPSSRYASAAALADDLRRWLRGEPIQARSVGKVERGLRWCQRHRAVTALLLLVLLLLLTVAIGASVTAWRERGLVENQTRARRDAEKNLARSQSANGLSLLEAHNGLGLLDLLDAERTLENGGHSEQWPSHIWSASFAACPVRLEQMMGHDAAVSDIFFSPDGKKLLSFGRDGNMRLWDPSTGSLRREALPGSPRDRGANRYAWSADCRRVAHIVWKDPPGIEVRDGDDFHLITTLDLPTVNHIWLSTDGHKVVAATTTTEVVVIDLDRDKTDPRPTRSRPIRPPSRAAPVLRPSRLDVRHHRPEGRDERAPYR
jgi:tRNA A-37 threonylcarbamoyl transferase component Bud32